MAVTSRKVFADVDDLLAAKRGKHAFLLVLDGLEDPHNLGALLRSANGAGVDGVVIPERRAAGITGTVVKASAGASEAVSVARVVNIARTLEDLKERNVWTVGLDERATENYDELDYNMDCAIVLGAEGKGLHDLVRRKCDMLVKIPMMGSVSSLNVSVAGGIVLYEVLRQRRALERPAKGKKKGK
jgi:23S rRNA (guanosine2251-2'-O)-methyltransferase